ncbi:MAG: carboxypeptidase regulatory-like domain-containing protein, partial [Planctomycetales bacterium]|nr:carboxypeptidase regulatory-like domain-containing protein [Planctomycetales bacterium]
GDVVVGFFADPRWWKAPPVQVRRFSGPGEYLIERIPPGVYYLGARKGSLPQSKGLGVERAWPRGIVVQEGETTEAHVLVSDDFNWQDTTRNPRDYVGDWPQFDPERLVAVRTFDERGTPLPFCQVNYSIVAGGPAGSYGTDYLGCTYRDDVDGEFSVAVSQRDFETNTLASRYHYRKLPQHYDSAARPVIDVVCDPFPTGDGVVRGRVLNQHGAPVPEFHLRLTRGYDGPESTDVIGLRIPFVDAEGRFEVSNLSPGEYSITASAFDYVTHVYQEPQEMAKVFVDPSSRDVEVVDVVLEARLLRYGQAVFDDGSPVEQGVWSGTSGSYRLAPDGGIRAALSERELERLKSLDGGEITVSTWDSTKQSRSSTAVAWDDLSENPTQPFTVVLARPAAVAADSRDDEASPSPDDPKAVLRLKQLGAFLKTRSDGSVREATFLESRFQDGDAELLQKIPSVEVLRFDRTEVGDSILAHVRGLTQLQSLEMRNAKVTDWGVRQLVDTASLRELNLARAEVTDDGLEAIAAIESLEELDVSGTQVGDAGLRRLSKHSGLKRLFMRDTRVTDAGLADVGRLRQLEELDITGCRIDDQGLAHLSELSNLARLDLYGCRVTDEGLAHLATMTQLRDLDLSGTLVGDQGMDVVAGFSDLEQLRISGSRITDAALGKLRRLQKLRVFYVGPNLSDAATSELLQFPQLEVLDVGGPKITDSGVEEIAKLRGLTNLFLSGASITDDSVPHLVQLRKLILLSVQSTQISAEGMKAFYSEFTNPPQVFGP